MVFVGPRRRGATWRCSLGGKERSSNPSRDVVRNHIAWMALTGLVAVLIALWTVPLLFDRSGFVPRWSCGEWSAPLGWAHIVSDMLTFAAYAAIPVALLWFVRNRPDVPFPGVFWLFAAFILACGTGHLVEAIIFWHPVYRLSGAVKVITAVVSWATVLALMPILPRALALPGLAKVNQQLQHEILSRSAAEAELLRRNADLERFHKAVVDREVRMLGLKREVNDLRRELGMPAAYDVAFAADVAPEKLTSADSE